MPRRYGPRRLYLLLIILGNNINSEIYPNVIFIALASLNRNTCRSLLPLLVSCFQTFQQQHDDCSNLTKILQRKNVGSDWSENSTVATITSVLFKRDCFALVSFDAFKMERKCVATLARLLDLKFVHGVFPTLSLQITMAS